MLTVMKILLRRDKTCKILDG